MSVNKTILLGRLGQDPNLSYIPSGTAVCKFSVATSEKYKDRDGSQKEKTEWHNCIVWGNLAEVCAKYLSKGREVYIEGKNQTTNWPDKNHPEIKHYKTEINVDKVDFIGSYEKKEEPQTRYPEQPSTDPTFTTDDIPF